MKAICIAKGSLLIFLLFVDSSWAQQDWEATSKESLLKADWSKVAEAAQQWKRSNAGAPVADWLLGYAGLATGDYNRALASFSRLDASAATRAVVDYASALTRHNSKNAVVQMLKGDALARIGKYEEAQAALDEAVRLDARSALIRDVRGVVHALAGKKEDAIADFEYAIKLEPKFADAHANLGLVRLAAGSAPDAVESLTQAIDLAPDFALAFNGRGVAYASMEAWNEAENDFQKAAELASGLSLPASNTQFINWTKGQIAFHQSLLSSDYGGRGSLLVARAYEHRVVDLADGKTMDVFIIKAMPQTSTLEGMKAVVKDITRRLRVENRLPNTWLPRLHMDAHGWNSTPYGQMTYAAAMAQQADRDAVIAVDLSSWYKGKNKIELIQKSITWKLNVTAAAEQTARINAAINEVTGIKPTFTGNSGGAEVIPRIGELMARGDLPTEVVKNVSFSNLVLTAYPFHQITGGDVEIPKVLLERIDRLSNLHTRWGQWSNTIKHDEKVINIQVTDALGKGIWHGYFINVTLPDGQPNPVIKIGGEALSGQGLSSSPRDEQNRQLPPLPSARAVARNLDRFYKAVDLLYKTMDMEMPMEMKAPLAFSGSILRDFETARSQKFNVLTSQALESMGKFGLKELPKLVDQLVREGKLPALYKTLLNSPLMAGLPDFVVAASSQPAQRSILPYLDELSRYAEGLFKITGAIIGGRSMHPQGAAIGASVAGMTADAVKGISQSIGRDLVLHEGGPRMIREWNRQVQSATARGLPAKTFSEMYGLEDLKQLGFDLKIIAEFDNVTRWRNSALDYRNLHGATSGPLQNLLAPIPTSTIPVRDDSWKKRLPDDLAPSFVPPPGGPPPPPAPSGGVASGAIKPTTQPSQRAANVNAPNSRLPSTALPGGVVLKADVVKNERADTSELFGGGGSEKQIVAARQQGLRSPFLLFCAGKRTFYAYSMGMAQARVEQAIKEGIDFRKKQPDLFYLGGITRPLAVVLDTSSNDWILVGEHDPKSSALTLDDWVAALRARFIHSDKDPGVTIDPVCAEKTPRDDCRDYIGQEVRFFAGIENTHFGQVCYEADWLMKRIALGLEQLPIEKLETYYKLLLEQHRKAGRGRASVGSRFWFYPIVDRVNVFGDVVLLEKFQMGIFTEVLHAEVDGKPVADVTKFEHYPSERFSRSLSENYDAAAEAREVLETLRGLARLAALAKGLTEVEVRPQVDYFLTEYPPEQTRTPKEAEVLRVKDQEVGFQISGGVSLMALAMRLAGGDASALKGLVAGARPSQETLSWGVEIEIHSDQVVGVDLPQGLADPSQIAPLFAQAMFLYEKKYYDAAIESYRQVLQLNPNLAEAYIFRGMAYGGKGNLDRAIQDFNQAISLDPNLAEAYNNRGAAYHDKGNLDGAIQDFNQAISINPKLAIVYNNRGTAYDDKGDFDRATQDYNQAISLSPKDATPYYNRGNVFYKKGDFDRAIQGFSQAISLNQNYAKAYNNRGIAYLAKGDFFRAIQDYNQVILLNPKFAEAYFDRGVAYALKGDYDRAIEEFSQAISLKPNYAKAYDNRGVAYALKGDYDRAIEEFNRAITLDPKHSGAHGNRGYAYYKKGEFERGIQDSSQAISLDPKNARAYKSRAAAYRALGKKDLADADEKKAQELSKQRP